MLNSDNICSTTPSLENDLLIERLKNHRQHITNNSTNIDKIEKSHQMPTPNCYQSRSPVPISSFSKNAFSLTTVGNVLPKTRAPASNDKVKTSLQDQHELTPHSIKQNEGIETTGRHSNDKELCITKSQQSADGRLKGEDVESQLHEIFKLISLDASLNETQSDLVTPTPQITSTLSSSSCEGNLSVDSATSKPPTSVDIEANMYRSNDSHIFPAFSKRQVSAPEPSLRKEKTNTPNHLYSSFSIHNNSKYVSRCISRSISAKISHRRTCSNTMVADRSVSLKVTPDCQNFLSDKINQDEFSDNISCSLDSQFYQNNDFSNLHGSTGSSPSHIFSTSTVNHTKSKNFASRLTPETIKESATVESNEKHIQEGSSDAYSSEHQVFSFFSHDADHHIHHSPSTLFKNDEYRLMTVYDVSQKFSRSFSYSVAGRSSFRKSSASSFTLGNRSATASSALMPSFDIFEDSRAQAVNNSNQEAGLTVENDFGDSRDINSRMEAETDDATFDQAVITQPLILVNSLDANSGDIQDEHHDKENQLNPRIVDTD